MSEEDLGEGGMLKELRRQKLDGLIYFMAVGEAWSATYSDLLQVERTFCSLVVSALDKTVA